MISAFGVDHGDGEIEKAFPGLGALSTLGAGLGRSATKLGNQTRRAGAAQIRGAAGFGAGKRAAPVKAPGLRNALGQGGMKVGGALKRVGGAMSQRPGLAGGLAAGGATAGVGGAGFAAGRMGGDNKKLQQYR